jgi:hypothetical protein
MRLQPRMAELASPCQSAFYQVKIHSWRFNFGSGLGQNFQIKKKKIPALLLDISEAFDTLSWEFLLELLSGKGLSRKWTRWIAGLFAKSTIILTRTIPYRRGLRQVDPLSPLLFVITMDVLPSSLKQWSSRAERVTHFAPRLRATARSSQARDDELPCAFATIRWCRAHFCRHYWWSSLTLVSPPTAVCRLFQMKAERSRKPEVVAENWSKRSLR